jgi:putative membrane protein
MYCNTYFVGMHWVWWIVWIFLLFWIFALPYNVPGQRMRRDSSIDILKRRLASGDITSEEYNEIKKFLTMI